MTMKTLTDLTKTTYERMPTFLVCHTPAICEKDLLSNTPVTKALHTWFTPCDGCFLTDEDGERSPLVCPLVDVACIILDAAPTPFWTHEGLGRGWPGGWRSSSLLHLLFTALHLSCLELTACLSCGWAATVSVWTSCCRNWWFYSTPVQTVSSSGLCNITFPVQQ